MKIIFDEKKIDTNVNLIRNGFYHYSILIDYTYKFPALFVGAHQT